MDYEKNIPEDRLNDVNGGEDTSDEVQLIRCPKCYSTDVDDGGILGYHCNNCGYQW